jgi:alpha-galactosidase
VTGRWALRTATTSYRVGLGLGGSALLLEGWGPAGRPDPGPWQPPDRKHSWEHVSDLAPMEHATAGTRNFAHADLLVDQGDGLLGARWEHLDDHLVHDENAGHRSTHLTVRFRDTTGRLRLDLHTVTSTAHDAVRRWSEVTHTGAGGQVVLRRAMTGGWTAPAPHGARVHYLWGRWGQELVPGRVDLRAGELHLGSRQGITSHTFAPYVSVEALDADGQPAGGGVVSAQLAWSGSWRAVAEAPPAADWVRIAMGLYDDALAVTLSPGESFRCPETVGLRAETVEDAARAWHQYERSALARPTQPEHRPVVYNSWYATTFDVRVAHQLQLADAAAAAGVEVFVVDDGWFRGRTDDAHGLGDWTPDETAFPDGLAALTDGVLARGMRFGIWVEPEAVNPDSDLYRAHPDWVYRAGDRPLTTMRNQLVLDLGRDDVVAWVEGWLGELLTRHPITFLKWDMNRPVTDGGRPADPRSAQWSVDHTLGYYRVMDMLRRDFPQVTVEACAGGGGRVDLAVLARSDVVWASDETGPRDRLVIQDGWLRCYPPYAMSSWVTDEPGARDTRPVSPGFRFVVAMAGALGIGSDLLAWSPEDATTAAAWVGRYKQLRPVLHDGAVRRVGDPRRGIYSVQYDGGRRHGGRIVVLVWDCRDADAGAGAPGRVLVPDARADVGYRLPGGGSATGTELAADGLPVGWQLAADADVLVLDPLTTT